MPAHLETHEIRVFRTVYEESGFNKAAEKLFVTQSAVSQSIANLEHKLDDRSKSPESVVEGSTSFKAMLDTDDADEGTSVMF